MFAILFEALKQLFNKQIKVSCNFYIFVQSIATLLKMDVYTYCFRQQNPE